MTQEKVALSTDLLAFLLESVVKHSQSEYIVRDSLIELPKLSS